MKKIVFNILMRTEWVFAVYVCMYVFVQKISYNRKISQLSKVNPNLNYHFHIKWTYQNLDLDFFII